MPKRKRRLIMGVSLHIGSHVSIRKGYLQAAKTAVAIGGTSFQYFPKNPRSLVLKTKVDWKDAGQCAEFCQASSVQSIGHAPYPLNPAAPEQDQDLMVSALLNALEIVEACGSIGLVVHFGKFSGKDPLQGYKNIIQCTNRTLKNWHGQAKILLENQAGEGVRMGLMLEELIQIRSLSDFPDKIGFCLDTCHAFACGLWNGMNWAELEQKGRELHFFEHLKAVHLNDSVYPSGGYRDRHANIGKGYIGLKAFKELLRSDELQQIPVVLETPAGPDGTHRSEIALVQSLLP
ncbi:endonuclease IV [Paenibacillus larvae subsp. pulvifaciens]|uniref:Endonuclease IV n=2 Tax=Paenibacillus larvae TaxID=1464 RepID=A0A1U9YRN0_9BACL|nr:endonuclease IV [Paenibacillus larvae subsp. pulvifaciens]AQZ48097.1 endonuclease IV [Paenibacillus larvae subsp. pulvifaciens]ARF66823.1 endonuclease IV [Paenibacillus larvae subsp. pulvifaciens]MBH0342491.1 endonuclease IV [Paenibacillus larvae]